MLYVIEARDKPGALQTRLDTRPRHLEYLESLGDALVLAGPFLDADEKPCGSLVVVQAESLVDAEIVAENDPYNEAGLFESVEVRRWNWAIKKPEHLK